MANEVVTDMPVRTAVKMISSASTRICGTRGAYRRAHASDGTTLICRRAFHLTLLLAQNGCRHLLKMVVANIDRLAKPR